MATFRCIRSGNTVSFDNQYDIEQMRRQTIDYVEVKDEEATEVATPDPTVKQHNKAKQRAYKGHPDSVVA
jgi:predicted kinase